MNKKFFIGLDLSLTGTGFVVLNEKAKTERQNLIISKPPLSIEERICFIIGDIVDVLLDIPPNESIIYMEGLSFGSTGASMLELAGLHYHCRVILFNLMRDFEVIPPTTLKKYITGKGNCKKNLMLLNVYKKWGVEFTDDNLCDAYSLARIALDKNIKDNNK